MRQRFPRNRMKTRFDETSIDTQMLEAYGIWLRFRAGQEKKNRATVWIGLGHILFANKVKPSPNAWMLQGLDILLGTIKAKIIVQFCRGANLFSRLQNAKLPVSCGYHTHCFFNELRPPMANTRASAGWARQLLVFCLEQDTMLSAAAGHVNWQRDGGLAMRLWIKDPIDVLAAGAERGLVIEHGRIVECVGHDGPAVPCDQIFDASRHVVLPGLINAHHHFYQNLTRAHPQAINKELFAWLASLYPIWTRHLDRDCFRLSVRVALTELLMSGCTTTTDHHFLFPRGLEDAVDIEEEEARRLGMRMTFARGTVNLRAADDGIGDDNLIQEDDAVLADCERVLGLFHDPSEGSFRQVALAPCALFNVTKAMMTATAQLAARFGCALHTHLGETRDENEYCLAHWGCRPLDYLEEVDWLGERTWLAHGIHFSDEEVRRLGRHQVGICHCPTSNMILASGQCRTKELEAAGAMVGLGVDGSSSNDNSNLMESVRHALLLGRLRYGSAGVTHLDALRWATEGSARCLKRSDIGTLAVGKQADLALYTLEELRFSGAGDPIAALVLCGAHRADRVMIGGSWRVTGGVPCGVDVERLRQEHGAAARRFLDSL